MGEGDPAQVSSGIEAAASDPRVVDTDGGPVTLEELPALSARQSALERQTTDLNDQARSLRSLAEDRLVDLASLVLDSNQWSSPPDVAALATECRTLRTQAAEERSRLDSLRTQERHGLGGMLGRVGSWKESRQLDRERVSVEAKLRQRLLRFVQLAPPVDFDAANNLRAQAE